MDEDEESFQATIEEEFDVVQGRVFGFTNGVSGYSGEKTIYIFLYLVPSQAYLVPHF